MKINVRKAISEAELRHTAQKGLGTMVGWFAREYPFRAALSVILFLVAGILDSVGILLLLPALALIIGESAGAQNWVTKTIFEILEFLGIPQSVSWILLMIVAVVLIKFTLRIFAGIIVGGFAARITQQVRAELLIAMVKAKWALFTRERTGDYIQALVNDAGKTSKASLAISQGISRVLQIAFLTATSFLISWQFTLAALVLGSFTTFGLHFFIRVLKRIAQAQVISMRLLNNRLIDGIGVMKALKAMGREGPFRENVLGDVDRLYDLQRRSIISNEFMRLIPEPMGAISIAVGMAVLLPYWQAGAESLLTVLYLFFRLHQGVSDLPMTLRDITTGQPAFYFVMSLRDATRDFEERARGNLRAGRWKELSLENVSFSHDDELILSNANLTIQRGEFVTFFGPSGSGKTTTVDLLIGLLEPSSGDILVDGKSLYEFDSHSWREQIGYVPQECILFNGTIQDNIRLGDDSIPEKRVRDALKSANALEFVEAMPNGLGTIVSERGLNLSGGQQQRLSLARALVREPKILVLDEVTSSLDHETEESICSELQRLHRQTNGDLTVIAISHRPKIAEIADRFFRIEQGKIIETAMSSSKATLVYEERQ